MSVLQTKQQKFYFFGSLLVIVALLVVTLWRQPDYHYLDNTNYAAKQQQDKVLAAAYAQYLKSIQTDPVASQKLLQSIISQDDIKQAVQQQLRTDQAVNLPQVADSSMHTSGQTGRQAVVQYFTDAVAPAVDFSQKTTDLNRQLFAGDSNSEDTLQQQYGRLYS
ncbi:MAG: hypothetical protein KGJ93_05550, partial [Patescibacteria group bacterium]|nr:hypothetical protein [Patescibacteria group bacterium]